VRVILLGTGTSHGIPMIGCDCAVCTSSDSRDKRTRPGIYIRTGQGGVLIDTPPELRLQCIRSGVRRVDAVLYTHHHADHIAGLDDLRQFCSRASGPIPCYGSAETLARLRRMYEYAFVDDPEYPSAKPRLELRTIDGPFELCGETFVPIRLLHGCLPVLGFRVGDFAYCTDCSAIPPESMRRLEGLDVLVLDALRRTPHPTHFHLAEAIEVARRIGARRTYFTHIAHELKHAETDAELPETMALAYDGLEIVLE